MLVAICGRVWQSDWQCWYNNIYWALVWCWGEPPMLSSYQSIIKVNRTRVSYNIYLTWDLSYYFMLNLRHLRVFQWIKIISLLINKIIEKKFLLTFTLSKDCSWNRILFWENSKGREKVQFLFKVDIETKNPSLLVERIYSLLLNISTLVKVSCSCIHHYSTLILYL